MERNFTRTKSFRENFRRSSWGAIIAGALAALAIAFLLNLLGLGIGLSTIDPMTESDPLAGLGTGTMIWWGLSNLVALFIGGMIAGRMAGFTLSEDGAIHGFLSWALFALISVWMFTSTVGGIINGMGNTISGIFGDDNAKTVTVQMQRAEKDAKNKATTSFEDIKQNALNMINKAENLDILPEDASANTREALQEGKTTTRGLIKSMDIEEFFNDLQIDVENGELNVTTEGNQEYIKKEELKTYLTNNTELSESEIENMVQNWQENIDKAINEAEEFYSEAKQNVVEFSDKAADAVGTISIVAFVILLLGALSAIGGGVTGSPKYSLSEENEVEKKV